MPGVPWAAVFDLENCSQKFGALDKKESALRRPGEVFRAAPGKGGILGNGTSTDKPKRSHGKQNAE